MTYRTAINGSLTDQIEAGSPLRACVIAMETALPPYERREFEAWASHDFARIETGLHTVTARLIQVGVEA